ncbi:hypothetical protein [Candidatus Paracaedibacter symbiosus]|uniref:hypothetical protein n=1 Tax=Candidatus Paracaedibacter symbiosus TaxID=244582 RepID=UPI000509DA3C|nr:hypothetical protein [Candidatus Paracaedibacter symbiosus]
MNSLIRPWGIVVFLWGTSIEAADYEVVKEERDYYQGVATRGLTAYFNNHKHDWKDFIDISYGHWGDSRKSLTDKFESIFGEEGKFTRFYNFSLSGSEANFSQSVKENVLQYKKAYVKCQCEALISHYLAHSRDSAWTWVRLPYEIDVLAKLETYAVEHGIPLDHYYHQNLGYKITDFDAVEQMNDKLVAKLMEEKNAK